MVTTTLPIIRKPRHTAPLGILSRLLVMVALLIACACDQVRDQASEVKEAAERAGVWDPTVKLNAQSKGVLYTWVDEEGMFQITEDPHQIPAARRAVVRIVAEGQSPGGPDHVFVADLSNLDSDFSVQQMSRDEWEARGKKGREKKIAELRPPEEEKEAPPSPGDLGVDAIVYGADWCKPCHLAEDYLKKKGARVVKKDIEEDPRAHAEMKQKLRAAGIQTSSIPVLDVGGTILRGFSAPAIDAALKSAKK